MCRDFSGKYGSGEGVGCDNPLDRRRRDSGNPPGVVLDGNLNILGVVGDENVLLVGGWRSEDKGETWTKSDEEEGFEAVLTYALDGSAIFGLRGSWIVKSTDKGLTWEKYGRAGVNVLDMAYDNQNDTLWVLGEGGYLFRFIDGERVNIELPTGGEMRTRTIACDPFDGNIIYVGNALNIAKSEASVIRSTDGGATWENMTKTAANGVTGNGRRRRGSLRCAPTRRPEICMSSEQLAAGCGRQRDLNNTGRDCRVSGNESENG